jgi:hypothetical protein
VELTQSQFIDFIICRARVKNDAALARVLNVQRSVISQLRHDIRHFGPSLIICVHEVTGLSIRDIKGMLGIECLASLD